MIAGIEMAKHIFKYLDPTMEFEELVADGQPAEYGDKLMRISGSTRAILSGERLALNCMQRMSGIATHASKAAKALEGTGTKVLDTRKTTPNFRLCEKWAVYIGGGTNHRYGLYDLIMLKDNHVDYAGGIAEALQRADAYRKQHGLNIRIELETRNLQEVEQALTTGLADIIMLDNMDIATMKEAVQLIGDKAETEASGNVTLERLPEIGSCGVDFVSMGSLTHSSRNIDISLKAL